MSDLPPEVTQSHLWQTTLAPRAADEDSDARDRLRAAFVTLRDRAALLAAEIRRDLPQLTLHEQKHMDALWETASTIVGPSFMLTPTEGFVLGGSFLLHDPGMALPSVDGGIQACFQHAGTFRTKGGNLNTAVLLWGVLFSAIGLGFFVYGKRQKMVVPLVCGIALMVYPYFVANIYVLVAVGVALACLPYFVRL